MSMTNFPGADLSDHMQIDDLKEIKVEAINAGVLASCAMVVLLNDETKMSQWWYVCVFHVLLH